MKSRPCSLIKYLAIGQLSQFCRLARSSSIGPPINWSNSTHFAIGTYQAMPESRDPNRYNRMRRHWLAKKQCVDCGIDIPDALLKLKFRPALRSNRQATFNTRFKALDFTCLCIIKRRANAGSTNIQRQHQWRHGLGRQYSVPALLLN